MELFIGDFLKNVFEDMHAHYNTNIMMNTNYTQATI